MSNQHIFALKVSEHTVFPVKPQRKHKFRIMILWEICEVVKSHTLNQKRALIGQTKLCESTGGRASGVKTLYAEEKL